MHKGTEKTIHSETGPIIILIVDRNPRIRNFLKREMAAEGYRIVLADKGHEMLSVFQAGNMPDIVIIDPNLSDADAVNTLDLLKRCYPYIPVIIHSSYPDEVSHSGWLPAAQVEKGGNSVEILKKMVSMMYPKNWTVC